MKSKKKNYNTDKSSLSALLLFLPALLVIIGGWYFTKEILKYKETQLLAKTGQLPAGTSGYSLQQEDIPENDTTSENEETDTFQPESLSEDMTARILACWEANTYGDTQEMMLTHEPQKGQLTMEQAINTGKTWIADMTEKGLLPSSLAENNLQNISATLRTLDEKPDIPHHLLSCWQVVYVHSETSISLTIHAASSQIWKAKIYTDNNSLTIPLYSDEILVDAAFPFLSGGGLEVTAQTENGLYKTRKYSSEGKLYATVQWSMVSSNEWENTFVGYTIELHSAE